MKFEINLTIDQIIDEIQTKFPNKTSISFISFMRCSLSKCYCDNFLKHATIRELFYLFYKLVIFQEMWNNSSKKWVSNQKSQVKGC